jgi:transcriptional regulator with XRE-family HTH domain
MSKEAASFKSIGFNLRSLREEAELTLKEVAAAVKLDVSLVSKLERDIRLPTVAQCELLAEFYGVSAEALTKERILSKMYSDYQKHAKSDPQADQKLITAVLEECLPRFAPDSEVLYVGTTTGKPAVCKTGRMKELGFDFTEQDGMPDIIAFYPLKKWLILVGSVLSSGPVDAKRHAELAEMFSSVKPGLVYVTAFPDRSLMARYLDIISWEAEVWIADAADHLIHFNGKRLLGPC